eukprot:UN04075
MDRPLYSIENLTTQRYSLWLAIYLDTTDVNCYPFHIGSCVTRFTCTRTNGTFL